ncbi:MAG: thioredoxin family protein [Bacteroidota bacterium]
MKKIFLLTVILLITGYAYTQDSKGPYNANADVRVDLKKAIDQAKLEKKHVLVQFGGNWCPWCLRFHAMVKNTPQLDSIVKADYIYVLANVPREKEKRDFGLFRDFNYPNRFGYPVFVILDGNGKELHIQDSGLLEHRDPNVKGYDTTKVVNFLKIWNFRALDPATYKQSK